ncbi:MAG: hypothetical protein QG623_129 [Patescibacteria group bacterium]|nr:hypothetical protein [Patescibacteria group bacterium]
MASKDKYPVSFEIDYPTKPDKLSSFFRIIWSIPVLLLVGILSGGMSSDEAGGITGGLFAATALMIVIRQKYPRWWFDFALELNRFSYRVMAYLLLLTDKYPSTTDKQSVHLNIEYPDVKKDLNRYLPLVKWILALPHYIVLVFLTFAMLVVTIIAWFAILFTGKYPRSLFDFVVGVGRWGARVSAYAFLLTTDKYPPFTLK